jgi:uncharacterized protein (DUF924 family)
MAVTVSTYNHTAAKLLGLGSPPAAGMPLDRALPGEELAMVRHLIGSERLPALERWTGPAGRQLVLRITQLRGRHGQPIGRTLVIADETRLRLLEDSARRAQALAALGEMAAGIAHEVRNPLTSLRGCAQELAEVATRGGRNDDARLAEIIVLDQFTRNIHRDSAAAFANDALALRLAEEAVAAGADLKLPVEERRFVYMPYMHSESAAVHETAMRLFATPGLETNLEFERRHKAIIDRFGRFPHRNALLGRPSTAEEIEFLKQPGSSF